MPRLMPTVEEVDELMDKLSGLENKLDDVQADKDALVEGITELQDACDRLTSNLGDIESIIKKLSRYS